MRERDLPPSTEMGEDEFPVEKGGLRHPRTEGQGGLPDANDKNDPGRDERS